MSSGDRVTVGSSIAGLVAGSSASLTVDSAEGPVLSGVEGLASGVGTGVAEGAPQAASSSIMTRLAIIEAFIFMFMPPG
jgi:hypothetical protein